MTTIVAWDLETTGRLAEGSSRWQDQPGITQFAALKIRLEPDLVMGGGDWCKRDQIKLYIDPELDPARWHPEAIEKTGISPDTVKDAPNLMIAHDQIARFFVGADYSMTYNGEWFDYPLLDFQLQRYGINRRFPWPPAHIDLMKYAADWYGEMGKRGVKRPTLTELYTHIMGKGFENAHDAGADVSAMFDIFTTKGGLQGLGYL